MFNVNEIQQLEKKRFRVYEFHIKKFDGDVKTNLFEFRRKQYGCRLATLTQT